jgi:hypothetical protein
MIEAQVGDRYGESLGDPKQQLRLGLEFAPFDAAEMTVGDS